MLTQRLWENGEYNGGYTAYTRYVCDGQGNCPSDASEYFYLKKFNSLNLDFKVNATTLPIFLSV
jgi:hypothetical protein